MCAIVLGGWVCGEPRCVHARCPPTFLDALLNAALIPSTLLQPRCSIMGKMIVTVTDADKCRELMAVNDPNRMLMVLHPRWEGGGLGLGGAGWASGCWGSASC